MVDTEFRIDCLHVMNKIIDTKTKILRLIHLNFLHRVDVGFMPDILQIATQCLLDLRGLLKVQTFLILIHTIEIAHGQSKLH